MPRTKLTREQAALSGADKKNPARYAGDAPKNDREIGAPGRALSAAEKKVFYEIVDQLIPGVATYSDRLHVELCAKLITEYRVNERELRKYKRDLKKWKAREADLQDEIDELAGDDNKVVRDELKLELKQHRRRRPPAAYPFPASRLSIIRSDLAKLGMTPVDRQRLSIPEAGGDEKDDFEALTPPTTH